MPYGDWTWGPETKETGSAPVAQDAPDAAQGETPATDRAQAQFGLGMLLTFLLGFIPGAQVLWGATLVCLVIWLASPAVGSLEASSQAKARTTGGGGCDVVLAGVILLVLAVGAVLFMWSLTEAGL